MYVLELLYVRFFEIVILKFLRNTPKKAMQAFD